MKTIQEMSLKEKIGQLIVAGFAGPSLSEADYAHFEQYHIGNFIYFARNVFSKSSVLSLSKELHELCLKNLGVEPFITVDQEGGMVTRIFDGAAIFPGNMAMAATDDVTNVYQEGVYMAQELLNLGINFNLAPVLDVNNNSHNPVIGVRSYGDDPQKVAEFGCAYIKGLQHHGVIATAKHFPGHGDTVVDSHYGLPVINYDLTRLEEVELVPFKAAIECGIDAIMTTHIKFSKLTQDDYPATLSKDILTGILREQLKFDGLIMTDCMEMKAIADHYGSAEGALLAILAGADLVCLSHSAEIQAKACDLIYEAVLDGRLLESRIDESISRILALKEKYKLQKMNVLSEETIEKHQVFARQMSRDSLTMVKGSLNLREVNTLVLSPLPVSLNAADDALKLDSFAHRVATELGADFEIFDLKLNVEQLQALIEKAKPYKQIIIGTYNVSMFQIQAKLVQELLQIDEELVAVGLRNPYDLEFYPEVKHFVASYEYSTLAVDSLVSAFKGEETFSGICPVKIAGV
ncbi:glycoside hydrolase family 3 protein [Turicibacter sanguinis]|jgi:glycoside hydrolase, family 3|uniref:glycoside hydrolase family 3 protein n=1 Tax=Turicibacter sanguinis TaxID=154288 RepID=UPI0012BBCB49|nr:glycoside hydrolase family 3 protein [Turicibacter sanguinis]MDB8540892.1 glycoside hydrolase family 3 protein [Turicibacter sanguinis]MDB8555591.1 glycoside hydrolase family 3 protein [Turicibacter sanguinis]MTN44554.1 beta-N-acetylhexosaminidase [Turicibacter sanguinis]MTN50402.1 beta-N-acetylhexosaminidase [Turicibacter sanguinis]MTN53614.1 beta-N-acetylhexosaminidase [Turicibacter sanguinis]